MSQHRAHIPLALIFILLAGLLAGFAAPEKASAASSAALRVDRYLRLAGSDGNITSNPPGIDCGPESNPHSVCEALFDTGTAVQLTVVPGPGSAFIGWVDSSQDITSKANPLTVNLDDSQTYTVTAGFSQNPVDITITFTDGSAHAGMPLFGSIKLYSPTQGFKYYYPDPIHGQVTVNLDQGEDYLLVAASNGYITQTRSVNYSTPTASESFALLPNPDSGCPIGYQVNASTSPVTRLDESFEGSGGLPTGWWQILYSDPNPGWKVASEGHTGSSSVFHDRISDGSNSFMDHLISALVHIPAQAKLTFYQKSKNIDDYGSHTLLLYHPYNGMEYLATLDQPTQEDTWQKVTYDLSKYAGQDLSIDFLYQASVPSGDQWFIDDVRVEGVSATCQPLSGGRVAGYVTNAVTGSLFLSARVTGGGNTFTTPDNGQYYLWLPTGTAKITAFAPGFYPQIATLTVAANAVTQQDFALAVGSQLFIPYIQR